VTTKIASVLIASWPLAPSAALAVSPPLIVVEAEAEGARYVMAAADLPSEGPDEGLILGAVYDARFRIVHVASGEIQRGRRITVRIVVTSESSISRGHHVVLVLQPREGDASRRGDEFELYEWHTVQRIYCISDDAYQRLDPETQERSYQVGHNRCIIR
jgi:hypothetical protein